MNKQTTRKYILNDNEKEIIRMFLNGELSSREAGKKLGYSAQGVINLTNSICRQWYQEGLMSLDKVLKSKPLIKAK